jgi:hypothetical protein
MVVSVVEDVADISSNDNADNEGNQYLIIRGFAVRKRNRSEY